MLLDLVSKTLTSVVEEDPANVVLAPVVPMLRLMQLRSCAGDRFHGWTCNYAIQTACTDLKLLCE